MQTTYIASDNTAANGTALGVTDQDIRIYKLIFGLAADGVYATIYNISNPYNGSTTNIAAKITQVTAAAGKNYQQVFDFGPQGLPITSGGNVITNASQVSVVWEPSAEAPEG